MIDHDTESAQCLSLFRKNFKSTPEVYAKAPGRINFIGEHVDYQEGIVLPSAINKYIYGIAARLEKPIVRLCSTYSKEKIIELPLKSLTPQKGEDSWTNYIIGVIDGYLNKGAAISGIEIMIDSNLPSGAGMSSSAALESVAATIVEKLFNFPLDPVDRAKICQNAEHQFAGVPCGIMDQIAVNLGVEGKALEIDCQNLEIQEISIPESISIIVVDSKVKHSLAEGEYGIRKEQCEEACSILGVNSLREASQEMVYTFKEQLGDLLFKRSLHVTSEILRVKRFSQALKDNNLKVMGDLLWESHESLSNDFEVSCSELDQLVELAKTLNAYGSRMMGGGFGGSTINLVDKKDQTGFLDQIKLSYYNATGHDIDAWALDSVSATAAKWL